MARKYSVYQVDAFTEKSFTGNPAGVVPEASGLSDREMQAIARELNNSETAFVFPLPPGSGADVHVRFFTPTHEVPICGHATIAAHYVRTVEGYSDASRLVQRTGAGDLEVDIVPEDGDYRVVMTQGEVTFGEEWSDDQQVFTLCRALGILKSDLDPRCPIQIVSTGHSKVMVGISAISLLHELKPNAAALAALSGQIECNGFYVFVLGKPDEDVLVHGRMFAPAIGIYEDPVTGNANGPLGAYLVRHSLVPVVEDRLEFAALQGEAIGRAGRIAVSVDVENGQPVRVRVSGRADIVFRTIISPPDLPDLPN